MASFFSKDDTIFGKPFSEWTCKWWQSFDYQGWRRNMGPVFMVPGMRVDTKGQITKSKCSFKIKSNKAILFAVINWLQPESQKGLIASQIRTSMANQTQMALLANERMDVVNQSAFNFMLDGTEQLREYIQRVGSESLFKIRGVKCASDGFWLFSKPNTFDKGPHHIGTFATCSSGQTKIGNEYDIQIL